MSPAVIHCNLADPDGTMLIMVVEASAGRRFRPVVLHVTAIMWTENDTGPGGWGAVLRYGKHTRELSGSDTALSNADLPLWALAESLEALTHPVRVEVHPDNILKQDIECGGDPALRERMQVQFARHDVVWHWTQPSTPATDDSQRAEALAWKVGEQAYEQAEQQRRAELDQWITLAKAFDRFLAEQRGQLNEREFADHERVLVYLRSYFHNYAYAPSQVEPHPEGTTFCTMYGPAEIEWDLGGFFGNFMSKVIDTQRVIKATGPVVKKLVSWLGEHDFGLSPDDIASMVRQAEEASEELPDARRFGSLWSETCGYEEYEEPDVTDTLADFVWISAVRPGVITLHDTEGGRYIDIAVPESVSALARTGWEVYLEGEQAHGEWHITLVGRVCI